MSETVMMRAIPTFSSLRQMPGAGMGVRKIKLVSRSMQVFASVFIGVFILQSKVQADEAVEGLDPYCLSDDIEILNLNTNFKVQDSSLTKKNKNHLKVLIEVDPHGCAISQRESELIHDFANSQGNEVRWFGVDSKWQLLPALLAGHGDLIAGQDKDVDGGTVELVKHSHSWASASYKVVERADSSRVSRDQDLAGRSVAAYKDSQIWEKLLGLQETVSGLVLREIPEDMEFIRVMGKLRSGEFDLVVMDSLLLDDYLPVNPDLRADHSISAQRNMAWAVKADANELFVSLNQFLNQQALTQTVESISFDDFSSLKEKRSLRIITSSSPSHYFLHDGNLKGFEYEFLSLFAKKHGMRVEVIVAESQREMNNLLKEGKGDVIAASLPKEILTSWEGVHYSDAYNYSSPVIVGRNTDGQLIDIRDLEGRRITLSQDSPYWDYLGSLKEKGINFDLVKADKGIDLEGVLLMVTMGMYDLTVIGSHELKSTYIKEIGLKPGLVLAEPVSHHWVTRDNNQQLLNELNQFINKEYRKEKYNVLYAKYFEKNLLKNNPLNKKRLTQFTSLSPYDALAKEYAEQYGFDWRLIIALMFQESRFNPNANSYAGAEGLMQLIPSTAEMMGVSDVNNPESSIDAGVRYLDYLRGKFEEDLSLEDKTWFTLASYNAGYGRVKQARELAEKMGLDSNLWFDNVEHAMLAMAKPIKRDGETIRRCRCGQAAVYVREIRTRYFNYIRLMDTRKLALYQPKPDNTTRIN